MARNIFRLTIGIEVKSINLIVRLLLGALLDEEPFSYETVLLFEHFSSVKLGKSKQHKQHELPQTIQPLGRKMAENFLTLLQALFTSPKYFCHFTYFFGRKTSNLS